MRSRKRITIDFETRSPVSLGDCGVYKYAEHPDTDITMLAVLDCDNPEDVKMWIGPNFRHLYKSELDDSELDSIVRDAEIVVCHNAQFELKIWYYIMERRYGFSHLSAEKTVDTAVLASQAGLPRSLEAVTAYWCPAETAKDMEGAKIMKRFMAPKLPVASKRKVLNPENPDEIKDGYERAMGILKIGGVPNFEYHKYLDWHEDPDDFERTVEYCRKDVIAEYTLFKTLPPQNAGERENWVLDQEINDRGVLVDVESAKGIIKTLDRYSEHLAEEASHITKGAVTSIKSPKQILAWLSDMGITVTSIDKANVEYLLSLDLKPEVRRLLEIRQTLGKSSVAKYDAMLSVASNTDNRARGLFAFYGANTGRFASRLIQLQNMPRPVGRDNLISPEDGEGDVDEQFIQMMACGNPDIPSIWIKDCNVAAADCIRSMMMAPKGRDFIVSDYSAIEARSLAFFANETVELESFFAGKDAYKTNAVIMFGVPYEEVTKDMRKTAKVCVLGCGYGGSKGALSKFGFDSIPVTEEEAYNLINNAENIMKEADIRGFTRLYDPMNTDYVSVIKSVYENPSTRQEAEVFIKELHGLHVVKLWRQAHPNTTKFWYELKNASVEAMRHPGCRIDCGLLTLSYKGRFLIVRLPSGRNLYYPDPKLEMVDTPWGSKQEIVTAASMNSMTRRMERRALNVSILVENVVQAASRDILLNALGNLKKRGYDTVMHIHDEIVAEVDEGFGSVEEFESVMEILPDWAEGFPLKADGGYRSKRYRKG